MNIEVAAEPARAAEAAALAEELGMALAKAPGTRLQLRLTAAWLELRDTEAGTAIHCDFLGGRYGYRRRHGGGRSHGLARAVGLKGGATPSVLDATAGLGRDGFLLADLGCRVTLVERTPAIYAILRDGLARAAEDPTTQPLVRERLRLVLADALDYLRSPSVRPDVVYLDPMHPERGKSAQVKKEMRLIRAAAGDDVDAARLLPAARACARERVVVKRPLRSEPLAGATPDWTIAGKTTRFDVYRTAGGGSA